MSDDFDPTPYVRPPIIDVASGVALATSLLNAVPKDPPESMRKAAQKVRKTTLALQQAWAKSDESGAPLDRRKADMRTDNAWGIFLDRLEAYASLPVEHYPKAARARALIDAISPERAWLKLMYEAQWAESDRRLEKIDSQGLAADVDALAGPEFLAEVRSAHKAYGLALGITKPRVEVPEVNLAEPLRELARAIGRYGLIVAGLVDDHPASLELVKKALRPIDEYRESQARRSRAGAAGSPEKPPVATPTTPLPEV